MTLDEARAYVGKPVISTFLDKPPGKGVITHVGPNAVYILFDGTTDVVTMHPRTLTPAEPGTGAPRAATHEDTIITYQDDGQVYDIDHLGNSYPDEQWGNFAVYRDGEMITEFCIPESSLNPEWRPAELPLTTEELIAHAKGAVAGEYATDEDVAAYMNVQAMIGQNLPSQN